MSNFFEIKSQSNNNSGKSNKDDSESEIDQKQVKSQSHMIAKMAMFNGSNYDEAETFIEDFVMYSNLLQWNLDTQKIQMLTHLTGNARKWFITLLDEPELKIDVKFRERYCLNSKFLSINKLRHLKFTNYPDMLSYIDDFKFLILKAGVTNNDEQLMYFQNGLDSNYSNIIDALNLDNLDNIIKYILKVEQKKLLKNSMFQNTSDNSNSNKLSSNEQVIAIQQQKFCRYCKRRGHIIDECRKRMTNNKKQLICFNCQLPGHIAKNCNTTAQTSPYSNNNGYSHFNASSNNSTKANKNQSQHNFKNRRHNISSLNSTENDDDNNDDKSDFEFLKNKNNLNNSTFYSSGCLNGIYSRSHSILPTFLLGTIQNNQIKILLDTGASLSVINFHNISSSIQNTLINSNIQVNDASGAPMQTVGKTKLKFSINNHIFNWIFHVIPSCTHQMIIGMDFLLFYQCKIDLASKCLYFNNNIQLPIFFESTSPQPVSVNNISSPYASFPQLHINTSVLNGDQQHKFKLLVQSHKSLFSTNLGHTKVLEHHIKLNDSSHAPIRIPQYPTAYSQHKLVESQVEHMLKLGVITPSSSSWNSPYLLVPKSNGKTRFCTDFRRLNSISGDESYPVPRIDQIIDQFSNKRIFSIIDLRDGFWQVPLAAEDQEKTAFSTHIGKFHYLRMPFGLKTAPASFQRMIEMVLSGAKGVCTKVYLDDIIIASSSVDQHLHDLSIIFKLLEQAGLVLSTEKSKFFQSSLLYLGHIISASGISPNPDKVAVIQSFPTPTSVKEVQNFLGIVGYYARYIKNISTIAFPLYQLLRKNITFSWTKECSQAFQLLKDALISSPVLGHPNFHLPFILHTDASNSGCGAILSQLQNNKEIVIAYWGKAFNSEQTNYSVYDKEGRHNPCLDPFPPIFIRPHIPNSN